MTLQADEAEGEQDIWHACRQGNLDKVKELVTSEVLQRVDKEGRSLLHWAVDRNHHHLAQWLLSQGEGRAAFKSRDQKIDQTLYPDLIDC